MAHLGNVDVALITAMGCISKKYHKPKWIVCIMNFEKAKQFNYAKTHHLQQNLFVFSSPLFYFLFFLQMAISELWASS